MLRPASERKGDAIQQWTVKDLVPLVKNKRQGSPHKGRPGRCELRAQSSQNKVKDKEESKGSRSVKTKAKFGIRWRGVMANRAAV